MKPDQPPQSKSTVELTGAQKEELAHIVDELDHVLLERKREVINEVKAQFTNAMMSMHKEIKTAYLQGDFEAKKQEIINQLKKLSCCK